MAAQGSLIFRTAHDLLQDHGASRSFEMCKNIVRARKPSEGYRDPSTRPHLGRWKYRMTSRVECYRLCGRLRVIFTAHHGARNGRSEGSQLSTVDGTDWPAPSRYCDGFVLLER